MAKEAQLTQNFDITVVTPSYNQAQFLEETIKSVLSQKGNFSLEYIVADGGSTDNSVEIIKKYDSLLKNGNYPINCRHVEFVWWSKKDKGQSDAINQGFKMARGKVLAWLNSDDLYEPNAIKEALELLESNDDAGLVYSNLIEINQNGHETRRHDVQNFDMAFVLNGGNVIPQPTAFFYKDDLEKVGYLNEKYHYAMDYDLWIRIGKEFKILHSPKYWAKFRMHESSKTVSLNKNFWKEEREISLKYGGNILSLLYINNLYRNHPVLMARIQKIMRGLLLLRRLELKDFKEKTALNIKHTKPNTNGKQ